MTVQQILVKQLDADRLPMKCHPEQIAADVRAYQALGIEDYILYLGRGGSPTDTMATMERFAREVMPLVG